jgi:hypothetical protein
LTPGPKADVDPIGRHDSLPPSNDNSQPSVGKLNAIICTMMNSAGAGMGMSFMMIHVSLHRA